jgi:hypothetical protein
MPVQLPTGASSLPPLGGRLLLVYRLAWWALAVTAGATLAWLLAFPPAAFGIELLRAAKAIVLIAVSAILFRRRRGDPVAAMLALAFLLWTISSSVDFAASSLLPAVIDRFRFLLFALALLLFPDGAWSPGWTRYVGMAILTTFVLGLVETTGLSPSHYFLPSAVGCVLAALTAMVVRFRALEDGAQKQQLKWVILGLACGIALILAARAGAALTRDMPIPAVGSIALEGMFQLGIVIIAIGFLTSLLRYRLYDAEAAISRSAVYAALTLTLVGTFAASEALIELLGQRFFGMAIGNVSGAIAAAIAAMMLTPLHGRITSWAEQHFQHDLVTLKQELPDLLAVMSSSASIISLAKTVLPQIGKAVHATRMALLVDGKLKAVEGISMTSARQLIGRWTPPEIDGAHDRDDGASFPLRFALRCPLGNIRAWLLLGPRPDGSFYGQDDLGALEEIGPALQRSLLLVVGREAELRRERARQRSLVHAIALLKSRLDELECSGRANA